MSKTKIFVLVIWKVLGIFPAPSKCFEKTEKKMKNVWNQKNLINVIFRQKNYENYYFW